MEPITVLELPAEHLKWARDNTFLTFAVHPLPLQPMWAELNGSAALQISSRTVTIRGERFVRRGREHTFLFTNDEESALLLKSALLPGQRKDISQREREAFMDGFIEGFKRAIAIHTRGSWK
jgi:hypothetical protein